MSPRLGADGGHQPRVLPRPRRGGWAAFLLLPCSGLCSLRVSTGSV